MAHKNIIFCQVMYQVGIGAPCLCTLSMDASLVADMRVYLARYTLVTYRQYFVTFRTSISVAWSRVLRALFVSCDGVHLRFDRQLYVGNVRRFNYENIQ